jgi:hypothetical protein
MRKKTIFFAVIALCLFVAAIAYYLYQKPRSSLTNVKPAYTLNATELYNAFTQNEKKANERYLEKVIQVKGTVDNIEVTDSTINLLLSAGNPMGGINCTLTKNKQEKENIPAKGGVVEVKGKCVGFLMDVNLVDAIIEQ